MGLRLFSRLMIVAIVASCAGGAGPLGLESAPIIDMAAPAVDGGAILIQWRYQYEGADPVTFEVRKMQTDLEQFPPPPYVRESTGGVQDVPINVQLDVPVVGNTAAIATSDWRVALIRDTEIAHGARVLYLVAALAVSGKQLVAVASAITVAEL